MENKSLLIYLFKNRVHPYFWTNIEAGRTDGMPIHTRGIRGSDVVGCYHVDVVGVDTERACLTIRVGGRSRFRPPFIEKLPIKYTAVHTIKYY